MIEWLPVANELLEKVATPLALTATLDASVVEPSAKVTEPVGVPEPLVTVAVKVTNWPGADGFVDDVSAVDVGAVTLCARVAVLGVPDVGVNVVLIVWLPAARVLVVYVACPLATATPLARTILPSLNDAVPDETGVTVAVNAMLCPTFAGFNDEASATAGFAGAELGNSGNVAFV